MPRAVIADELGPIENYTLREFDPGPLQAGQVRIAVKAAGVSFVDVLTAAGGYQLKPPVPFIPGSECAGIIEAVGKDVTGLSVGQKVTTSGFGGIFADVINATARAVQPMPQGLSYVEASVYSVSSTTSWHALVDRGQLKAGETLLVLGAGGATGYAAVQIGKYLGAHVIASASSEAKREIALKGGAAAAVTSGAPTWREDVKAANRGKPVDVVFDPVGGKFTELAFRSLGWNGRHLVVGFPDGIASLPTNLPLLKSASLVGVNLRHFGEVHPESAHANSDKIFALVGQGLFKPAVAKTFPLAQFAGAMAEVASGNPAGRIVLVME
ncbi:MAG: NADPH:quinone oxidoreductase family protein [Rhodospirillaceae bacterium]|nr:MAG: NADPH:quinone oxidoreductase family protein [Rhodospirillaceae bacterium]